MRAAIAAFSRLLDALSALVLAFAGGALVALVVALIWMVFGRYVLNDTPTWVERGAQLAILFIVLPIAAVGVREGFHMSVGIVADNLPARARTVLATGVDLAVLAFGAAMLHWGLFLAEMYRPFNIPLLGLSQGWQFAPMAICGGLTLMVVFERLLRRLAGMPPIASAARSE